jgi:hypothetical protein
MADVCRWCGEAHDVDRLCQRAQRGMTRRSFCFLFSAGVAAATASGLSGFWDRADDPLFNVVPAGPTLYLYTDAKRTASYFYGSAWLPIGGAEPDGLR